MAPRPRTALPVALLSLLLASFVAHAGKPKAPTAPAKPAAPPSPPPPPTFACKERTSWADLLRANDFLLGKDPSRTDTWQDAARKLAVRWSCTYGGTPVQGGDLNPLPEQTLRTVHAQAERADGGLLLEARWLKWHDDVGSGFEQALVDAGDPCARERSRVFKGLGGPERQESVMQPGTLIPFVGALWQCEGASGQSGNRDCLWARAAHEGTWNNLRAACGSSCRPEMEPAEACRWAFGTRTADRDDCAAKYAAARELMTKACASFACEDARAALQAHTTTITKECDEGRESCWRQSEEYRKKLADCAAQGRYCGSKDWVTESCVGWEKPCSIAGGATELCHRSAAGEYPQRYERECVAAFTDLQAGVARACGK